MTTIARKDALCQNSCHTKFELINCMAFISDQNAAANNMTLRRISSALRESVCWIRMLNQAVMTTGINCQIRYGLDCNCKVSIFVPLIQLIYRPMRLTQQTEMDSPLVIIDNLDEIYIN